MSDESPARPMPFEDHQTEARREAVRRARGRLAEADLAKAVTRGGLTVDADGRAAVVLLGRGFRVAPDSLEVMAVDAGRVSLVDELLILRYLEVEREVQPTGREITFRDLPGGNFYAAALAKRTTGLLIKRFGEDPESLRTALDRFPRVPLDVGDVAARVSAIGRIEITLVFRATDEEFPATADILYDHVIASVYSTDEVAALTTHLCVGLVRQA